MPVKPASNPKPTSKTGIINHKTPKSTTNPEVLAALAFPPGLA
jgi:hypothetical protein